jgi:hypothetical protein
VSCVVTAQAKKGRSEGGGVTKKNIIHETRAFANLKFLLFLADSLTMIGDVISIEGKLLMLPLESQIGHVLLFC